MTLVNTRDVIDLIGLFGALPTLGAASLIASEKIATKYGHAFMQSGISNTVLLGTIGAVHNLAAMIITAFLHNQTDQKNDRSSLIFFLGQTLTGGMLFGLTALAAKVNLISSKLTYFGGSLIILNGMASSFALFASIDWLANKLDPVP